MNREETLAWLDAEDQPAINEALQGHETYQGLVEAHAERVRVANAYFDALDQKETAENVIANKPDFLP